MVSSLQFCLVTSQKSQMTLKIERDFDGRKTVVRLSGRLQSEHLDELMTQIDGDQSRIALDLDGVTLVDVEVVRFLSACENGGIELIHCWPYIREWIIREKVTEGQDLAALPIIIGHESGHSGSPKNK